MIIIDHLAILLRIISVCYMIKYDKTYSLYSIRALLKAKGSIIKYERLFIKPIYHTFAKELFRTQRCIIILHVAQKKTYIRMHISKIKSYSLDIFALKVTKKKSTSFVGFPSTQKSSEQRKYE